MPLFLSASSILLPTPALNLLPSPPPPIPPPRHRRCFLPAPLTSSRHPPRQLYRRRRDGPPTRLPPRTSSPPPPRPQPQSRPANAAAPGRRGQDELEEAIYDFMRRSAKPGAFPTRDELVAAGRADLAAAVASSGGWLALGWSSPSSHASADGGSSKATAAPVSSGGGHPDYPTHSDFYDRNLAPGGGSRCREEGHNDEEEEASPSGRTPETEEPREVRLKAGIEGMLTRLQRDRERARPRSSNGGGGRPRNGGMPGFSSQDLTFFPEQFEAWGGA